MSRPAKATASKPAADPTTVPNEPAAAVAAETVVGEPVASIELPVAAESASAPSVVVVGPNVSDFPTALARVVDVAKGAQRTATFALERDGQDPVVALLAEAVVSLASCVEVLAKVNA